MQLTRRFVLSWLALVCLTSLSVAQQALPSWNDGKTRQAIEAFVERVTTPGSPDFVPESDRIAVFDNDGTLWSEQPMYVQLAFILDRVKALAPEHPEWKEQPPFNAVLNGDLKALAAAGERGLMELLLATHAGMTSEEFEKV
ncbi:MAG: haloacid dehalogenase-like hydrolase, partial [Planctomycetota bacterium]